MKQTRLTVLHDCQQLMAQGKMQYTSLLLWKTLDPTFLGLYVVHDAAL